MDPFTFGLIIFGIVFGAALLGGWILVSSTLRGLQSAEQKPKRKTLVLADRDLGPIVGVNTVVEFEKIEGEEDTAKDQEIDQEAIAPDEESDGLNIEENVVLRDVQESDLPITFQYEHEPEGFRMAMFAPREEAAYMAHWRKIMKDRSNIVKTVVVDGEVAGGVFSWVQDGDRLVGYWLGKEYWGRGVMTRSLMIFLEQVTIRPLYARVAEQNLGSIRVLEKCGFKVIGHDNGLPYEGREVQEVIMELDAPGRYVQ